MRDKPARDGIKYAKFLYADKESSDWVDVQANLSLHCGHIFQKERFLPLHLNHWCKYSSMTNTPLGLYQKKR